MGAKVVGKVVREVQISTAEAQDSREDHGLLRDREDGLQDRTDLSIGSRDLQELIDPQTNSKSAKFPTMIWISKYRTRQKESCP